MFRLTVRALSKRTPGYVFWRQSSLTELQHSKRNYLMSERPVPLAHVSRRMARVKARYEDTRDFHERNLLRGEYKYFTGKLCDYRAAPLGDMIVVLQCGAFFGFWDAAQVDRLLAELFLQLEALSAIELVALFACMPPLRRQESELYRRVSAELVVVVDDLTLAECVEVCRGCTSDTPPELLERVQRALTAQLTDLTPSQCVEVLDTWSVAPALVRLRTHDGVAALRERALGQLDDLTCVDIAVLYFSLQAGSTAVEDLSESVQRRLLQAFTRDLTRTCPRSTAMMFTAVRRSHSLALEATQQMADRVLFLSTDFTPAELLAVFQLYLDNLVSLCVLAADLKVESTAAAAHLLEPQAGPRPSLLAGSAQAMSDAVATSSARALVPSAISPYLRPRQHGLEREVAAQNVATLRHVCTSLSEQLVTTLESASAYVSVASQMEIVDLYTSAVEQLELSAECGTSTEAMAYLLRILPQSRRVLQLVSGKLIANMKHASLAMLISLLEQANSLGNAALQDAVVAAAVQELLTRDISGLTTEAAMALEQKLRSLTQLRAEHQRRLVSAFIPKVRRYV